jgi:hypothetical protein
LLLSRRLIVRALLAVLVSVPIELFAVHTHITDNILWPPTTPGRALALIPLVLAWLPAITEGVRQVWRHRPQARSDR